MRVREVGPDDWVVWRLLRQRSLAEDPQAFASSVAASRQGSTTARRPGAARLAAPGRRFFVAEHGSAPVGMVAIRPDDEGDGHQLDLDVGRTAAARDAEWAARSSAAWFGRGRRTAAVAARDRRQRDRHRALSALRVRARGRRPRRRGLPRDASGGLRRAPEAATSTSRVPTATRTAAPTRCAATSATGRSVKYWTKPISPCSSSTASSSDGASGAAGCRGARRRCSERQADQHVDAAACTWLMTCGSRPLRGESASPACGPLPVTIVPR